MKHLYLLLCLSMLAMGCSKDEDDDNNDDLQPTDYATTLEGSYSGTLTSLNDDQTEEDVTLNITRNSANNVTVSFRTREGWLLEFEATTGAATGIATGTAIDHFEQEVLNEDGWVVKINNDDDVDGIYDTTDGLDYSLTLSGDDNGTTSEVAYRFTGDKK